MSRAAAELLDREPVLWLSALGQVLALAAAVGVPGITSAQAGLITAAATAVLGAVAAARVRPIAPAAFTAAAGAVAALLAGYGVDVPPEVVPALSGAVVAVLALLTRGQVSPPASLYRGPAGP